MKRSGCWWSWVGVALICSGLFFLAETGLFYQHSRQASTALLNQSATLISPTPQDGPVTPSPDSSPPGHLLGELTIPKLTLRAPVVSGTGSAELASAVGHLRQSDAPGSSGTALLAGHNATWFRHLDRLSPGDEVRVATPDGTFTYEVTGARIVHLADGVPKPQAASVVLMTCYPLDALHLTDYRYLVYATMKKAGEP